MEQYYPVNDVVNEQRFKQYKQITDAEEDIIFGGRLAENKYYDMHQVIGSALAKAKVILNEPEMIEG